jgi:hypothetical protein
MKQAGLAIGTVGLVLFIGSLLYVRTLAVSASSFRWSLSVTAIGVLLVLTGVLLRRITPLKKIAAVALGFVAFLAIPWLAPRFLPYGVVTNHYATLQEARAAGFPVRVWLPEILPESTVNIRTEQNVDLNIADGEFSLAVADYPAFAARLTPYHSMRTPFEDFEREVRRMLDKGFEARTYTEENITWVFFCTAANGRCEFTMWLQRG